MYGRKVSLKSKNGLARVKARTQAARRKSVIFRRVVTGIGASYDRYG